MQSIVPCFHVYIDVVKTRGLTSCGCLQTFVYPIRLGNHSRITGEQAGFMRNALILATADTAMEPSAVFEIEELASLIPDFRGPLIL